MGSKIAMSGWQGRWSTAIEGLASSGAGEVSGGSTKNGFSGIVSPLSIAYGDRSQG